MMPDIHPNHIRTASYLLAALALVAILKIHLLPALFAGLLVFELVHLIAPRLEHHFVTDRGHPVAVALLATVVVTVFVLSVLGAIAFFRSDAGNLSQLMVRMEGILTQARMSLPAWVIDMMPVNVDQVHQSGAEFLRNHAVQLQKTGMDAALGFVHVLFGMVIGAMVATRETMTADNVVHRGPLAHALIERLERLSDAFQRVVFAQVRISAINTFFTALYLMVALPLFGVALPLAKTMVAITFLVGLLPVIGNLISNTLIVLVSLAHSPQVALTSLSFLVIVHKLEYFLNARIVGFRINARVWELLTAMLFMQALFGLPGLVAAPVAYAWLKDELTRAKLL